MTSTDIARLRLHNQLIARAKFNQPGAVVAWMGAVQAQDYLGALWAVGLRTRKAVEPDIAVITTLTRLQPITRIFTPSEIK